MAQQVEVSIDERLAQAAGIDATEVQGALRSEATGTLHLSDNSEYMQQMANAAISSVKGMGVDYASNPQRFAFGLSMGTASNGGGLDLSRSPEGLPTHGFAFQAMALAGVNLGVGADDDSILRRFVVYGNGMVLSNSREPFAADLFNFGAHLQIKLVRPPPRKGVEWGGVDVTNGYEASNYKLTLSSPLPIDTGGVTWDAVGTYTITSSAGSVPVEVSTNVRLLVVSVFAGGAIDINPAGSATSEISLDGDIDVEGAGQSQTVGAARVTFGTRGLSDTQVIRGFGGVQVNLLMAKVYAHINAGIDGSVGGHVGARVAL